MCFDRLKEALYSTLILILIDLKKPFVVDADAADQVVGAVVLQAYKDKLHLVAYFSIIYCPEERSCPAHEKELLEIFKA